MRIVENKSVIGQGIADVYKSGYGIDSLSVFNKNIDEVFCLKSLDDWEKHKNKNCVLVEKGPRDVLWAKPVIDGKIVSGMWGGCYIYSSNNVVMNGYPHPIRLMDRVER